MMIALIKLEAIQRMVTVDLLMAAVVVGCQTDLKKKESILLML
jgi:hypothetical protein